MPREDDVMPRWSPGGGVVAVLGAGMSLASLVLVHLLGQGWVWVSRRDVPIRGMDLPDGPLMQLGALAIVVLGVAVAAGWWRRLWPAALVLGIGMVVLVFPNVRWPY